MATEKLAKSYSCYGLSAPPKPTHSALVNFLQTIAKIPTFRKRFKAHTNHDLQQFVTFNLSFALQIESLAPSVRKISEPTNAEYPWQDALGTVICPATYPYSAFNKPQLMYFVKLIDYLFAIMP